MFIHTPVFTTFIIICIYIINMSIIIFNYKIFGAGTIFSVLVQ